MNDDNTQQPQQSTGIVGEIKEAFHKLEDGLEHLVDDARQAAQDDLAAEGNAAASNAWQPSENGTQAFATTASPDGGTPATQSQPVSAEQAKGAITKLRAHLWTYTQEAVSALHAELDKLETFVKSI